jgi:hypothetical protein
MMQEQMKEYKEQMKGCEYPKKDGMSNWRDEWANGGEWKANEGMQAQMEGMKS